MKKKARASPLYTYKVIISIKISILLYYSNDHNFTKPMLFNVK